MAIIMNIGVIGMYFRVVWEEYADVSETVVQLLLGYMEPHPGRRQCAQYVASLLKSCLISLTLTAQTF